MAPSNYSHDSNRGSVLISSLVILFVLVTIFIAILTFAIQRYGIHVKNQHQLLASHISEAGVQRALAKFNRTGLEFGDWEFETPNDGICSVSVLPWGPYALVQSSGIHANQRVIANALIGNAPTELVQAAVVIGDERLPLVGAGQSRIIGDVITGPQGATTGRIKGKGPGRDDFIDGELRVQTIVDLPSIDSTVLQSYYRDVELRKSELRNIHAGSFLFDDENKKMLQTSGCLVENNASFDGLTLSSNGNIQTITIGGYAEFVNRTSISGPYEFNCTGPITITDSTILDQVILISPDSIVFSGNSRFSGIAISGSRIIVRDSARLEYPSLLMIDPTLNQAADSFAIIIESHLSCEATCYLPKSDSPKKQAKIIIDSSAILTGYLISHDQAEIRGKVFGTAMTERFQFTRPPTTYINWLDDAYINRSHLDYNLALPLLVATDSSRYTIIRQTKTE